MIASSDNELVMLAVLRDVSAAMPDVEIVEKIISRVEWRKSRCQKSEDTHEI